MYNIRTEWERESEAPIAHALQLFGLRNALNPSCSPCLSLSLHLQPNKVACCNSEQRCSHSLRLSLSCSLSLLCCYCNFVFDRKRRFEFFVAHFCSGSARGFLSSYTYVHTYIHIYLCVYIFMHVCVHLICLFMAQSNFLWVWRSLHYLSGFFFHFLLMFGSCCFHCISTRRFEAVGGVGVT